MSRKTGKLKKRLRVVEQQLGRSSRKFTSLEQSLQEARRELEDSKQCNAFRFRVNRYPSFRFGSDKVYGVAMQVDLEALRYGMFGSCHPMNISRDLHYLCQDMARKLEAEIFKQLTADGVL